MAIGFIDLIDAMTDAQMRDLVREIDRKPPDARAVWLDVRREVEKRLKGRVKVGRQQMFAYAGKGKR